MLSTHSYPCIIWETSIWSLHAHLVLSLNSVFVTCSACNFGINHVAVFPNYLCLFLAPRTDCLATYPPLEICSINVLLWNHVWTRVYYKLNMKNLVYYNIIFSRYIIIYYICLWIVANGSVISIISNSYKSVTGDYWEWVEWQPSGNCIPCHNIWMRPLWPTSKYSISGICLHSRATIEAAASCS